MSQHSVLDMQSDFVKALVPLEGQGMRSWQGIAVPNLFPHHAAYHERLRFVTASWYCA
jgi:hypothetical protein